MEVYFGLIFVLNFENVIENDFDVFLVKALAEVFGVFATEKIWLDLALVAAPVSVEKISVIAFFVKIRFDTVSTFGQTCLIKEMEFICSLANTLPSEGIKLEMRFSAGETCRASINQ